MAASKVGHNGGLGPHMPPHLDLLVMFILVFIPIPILVLRITHHPLPPPRRDLPPSAIPLLRPHLPRRATRRTRTLLKQLRARCALRQLALNLLQRLPAPIQHRAQRTLHARVLVARHPNARARPRERVLARAPQRVGRARPPRRLAEAELRVRGERGAHALCVGRRAHALRGDEVPLDPVGAVEGLVVLLVGGRVLDAVCAGPGVGPERVPEGVGGAAVGSVVIRAGDELR